MRYRVLSGTLVIILILSNQIYAGLTGCARADSLRAENTNEEIILPQMSAKPGNPIIVSVHMRNVNPVKAFRLFITYDTSFLEPIRYYDTTYTSQGEIYAIDSSFFEFVDSQRMRANYETNPVFSVRNYQNRPGVLDCIMFGNPMNDFPIPPGNGDIFGVWFETNEEIPDGTVTDLSFYQYEPFSVDSSVYPPDTTWYGYCMTSAVVVGDNEYYPQQTEGYVEADVSLTCCRGLQGNVDCSEDETAQSTDLEALIEHLFITDEPLCCLDEADLDFSGRIDAIDLAILIDRLFISMREMHICPY